LVAALVDDKEGVVVLGAQDGMGDPARVGVFIDKTLTVAVDQQAPYQQGRVDTKGTFKGVHVTDLGTHRLADANGPTVMGLDGGTRSPQQPGRVGLEQGVRVGEASSRQYDPSPGPHRDLIAVVAGDDTEDRAVRVDDESLHRRVVPNLSAVL